MPPTPLPTVAPARATLVPAAVPPAPHGLNPADWRTHHEFIHLLDAVYEHVEALPNRQTKHVRQLSLLYWNHYVAGTVLSGVNYNRWASAESLFSNKSRLKLAIANLHLASKRLPPAKRVQDALDTWNAYLDSLNLPRVNGVGAGLNGAANPGPNVGPAVAAATAAGTTGSSGAPAPFASASNQMTSDDGDVGERLRRLDDDGRAAVAALLDLRTSTAGPSIAAATVGVNDDDDEDEEGDDDDDDDGGDDDEGNGADEDGNTNTTDTNQPPRKRQRLNNDNEDGFEGAIDRERSKEKGKGKQRAEDW